MADLAPQMIAVGGNSQAAVGFAWPSAGVRSGVYTAIATEDVEKGIYGPAQQGFQIASPIYLPLLLKNAP